MIDVLLSALSAEPTTRFALRTKLGMSDRGLRQLIRKARREGFPIVSSSGSAGYYLAQTRAEIEPFCMELENRAKDCLYTASRLRKLIPLDGQDEIYGGNEGCE